MRLESVQNGLWVATAESQAGGIELGLRMTVVKLRDGSLWIHSPVPLDDELRSELDALGPVRHVVSPNLFHHLYVRPFREAYPEARFYGAPGLQAKRKNFRFDEVLGDTAPSAWSQEIDQVAMHGAPRVNEVVFFHRESQSLILTDLAFNLHRVKKLRSKVFYYFWGVWKKFGPSVAVKFLVKDRKAFKASIRQVFDWDFDRVILAHGDILATGGKEAFQTSFDWL